MRLLIQPSWTCKPLLCNIIFNHLTADTCCIHFTSYFLVRISCVCVFFVTHIVCFYVTLYYTCGYTCFTCVFNLYKTTTNTCVSIISPSPPSVGSPESLHKASSVWTLDSCLSAGIVEDTPPGIHDQSVCPPTCPSPITAYSHYLETTG